MHFSKSITSVNALHRIVFAHSIEKLHLFLSLVLFLSLDVTRQFLRFYSYALDDVRFSSYPPFTSSASSYPSLCIPLSLSSTSYSRLPFALFHSCMPQRAVVAVRQRIVKFRSHIGMVNPLRCKRTA